MPIFTKSQAISLASRYTGSLYKLTSSGILRKSAQTFSESDHYDIFLSHAHADAREILGVAVLINQHGFSTYVDWIDDKQLSPSSVTRATIFRIKQRMATCSSLFYVASENAPNSKWMPWELGYLDGLKNRVAVFPLLDAPANGYVGREYLGVYPYISQDNMAGTQEPRLWVNETPSKYVLLSDWLQGSDPTQRPAPIYG